MPVSFKSLVGTKTNSFYTTSGDESNLERGQVWSYTPGNDFSQFTMCWIAPSRGTAVIEIWGAGGSTGRMCCCGGGTPGNAGAYSKKTIKMEAGCFICGSVGYACGNDAMCFRGCSDPTGLFWYGNCGASGCMCAQGGAGGRSMCSTGTSLFCCFVNQGMCFTGPYNDNCGLICNYFGGIWIACGYGGDVNRCGHFSCSLFVGCLPQCPCSFQYFMATPAGQFAKCGGVVQFGVEDGNEFSNWAGQGPHQHQAGLNGLSRKPNGGVPWAYCWGAGVGCGCYENQGCSTNMPPGHPAMAVHPCPAVRDNGNRGGHGAIRIKFIQGF